MRERGEKLILEPVGFFRLLARLALAHEQLSAFFCRACSRRHVKNERQHGNQMARLVTQHGVIPLAIQHRSVPRVVAITLDSKELRSQALPIRHLLDGVYVFVKNEMPVANMLADYFFRRPTKQTLRRLRPARYTEVAVPLDYSEGRILNMKSQALMNFLCFRLCALALGDVANDGDTAGNLVVLIVEWRIETSKKSLPASFRNRVRAVLRYRAFSRQSFIETFVLTGLFQNGKDFECIPAERVATLLAGDALHGPVPRGVAIVSIERENTVHARIEQALGKQFFRESFVAQSLVRSGFWVNRKSLVVNSKPSKQQTVNSKQPARAVARPTEQATVNSRQSTVDSEQSTLVNKLLPSAVCRLPSAVCCLPSAVCFCRLPSAVCRLPSAVYCSAQNFFFSSTIVRRSGSLTPCWL